MSKDEIGPLSSWRKVEDEPEPEEKGRDTCRAAFTDVELPAEIASGRRLTPVGGVTGSWSLRDLNKAREIPGVKSATGRMSSREEPREQEPRRRLHWEALLDSRTRHVVSPSRETPKDTGQTLEHLRSFFKATEGEEVTYRFKDWDEFTAAAPEITSEQYWSMAAEFGEIVKWDGRYWEKITDRGIITWRQVTYDDHQSEKHDPDWDANRSDDDRLGEMEDVITEQLQNTITVLAKHALKFGIDPDNVRVKNEEQLWIKSEDPDDGNDTEEESTE